jgi:hypothetical protein
MPITPTAVAAADAGYSRAAGSRLQPCYARPPAPGRQQSLAVYLVQPILRRISEFENAEFARAQISFNAQTRPLMRPLPYNHNTSWSVMTFLRIVIPLQLFSWRVIFSENRFPPRIKCGAGFFRIMR